MHVAARYEELRVAGFRVTEPKARPRWLRWEGPRIRVALQLLRMNPEGEHDGKAAGAIGAIDIDDDIDPVAHRHRNVFVADHPGMLGRPFIIRRRLMARRKQLLGGAHVVVFHSELDLICRRRVTWRLP